MVPGIVRDIRARPQERGDNAMESRPDDADRADEGVDAQPGQYTRACLVLLAEGDVAEGLDALRSGAGIRTAAHIGAGNPTAALDGLADGDAVVFDQLGVAVVAAEPDRREALLRSGAASTAVLAVEQARIVYALANGRSAPDERVATWGLQATHAADSRFTGDGVGVAVLDTGLTPVHRDFTDRVVKKESFVPGETVDDGHGHGTHCIGTACGPREPTHPPRYGVAGGAAVYAGKVLNNEGYGTDTFILAGMNWAIGEGCRVISLSLGSPAEGGDTYSQVYEQVARRARRRGTVIVAAAGNESRRPERVASVGHPANCPSILAVAAVAADLSVAPFSCAGLNPDGGLVDIAAPGVSVLSAYPEPTAYRRLSGTSMATPHVAGILALLAQAHPGATAAELVDRLLRSARPLPLPSSDVGAGLAQAPS
jgi:subtilisin family serine protease